MSANLSASEQLIRVSEFSELPPLPVSYHNPHWVFRARPVYRLLGDPLAFAAAWVLFLFLLLVLCSWR